LTTEALPATIALMALSSSQEATMDPLVNFAQVTGGFVLVSAVILGLRTIASFALSVHERKIAKAKDSTR
jgi:hypothetical protein